MKNTEAENNILCEGAFGSGSVLTLALDPTRYPVDARIGSLAVWVDEDGNGQLFFKRSDTSKSWVKVMAHEEPEASI